MAAGDEVSQFYDPMIAKLVVHRPDRDGALGALRAVMSNVTVWPVRSNAGFLTRALTDPQFIAGEVDTGLIARKADSLVPDGTPSTTLLDAAADYAVFMSAHGTDEAEKHPLNEPTSPWRLADGFRLNRAPSRLVWLSAGGTTYTVARSDGEPSETVFARYTSSGLVATEGGETFVFGRPTSSATGAAADGAILAPMPGRIIAVEVAAGEQVAKGQKLVTLEAMKMEHTLTAPFDGTVAELNASAGGQVAEGATRVRVERR